MRRLSVEEPHQIIFSRADHCNTSLKIWRYTEDDKSATKFYLLFLFTRSSSGKSFYWLSSEKEHRSLTDVLANHRHAPPDGRCFVLQCLKHGFRS